MNKYIFYINWQTRCRGEFKQVIIAESEDEAREILTDELDIDLNSAIRSDMEWEIDEIENLGKAEDL